MATIYIDPEFRCHVSMEAGIAIVLWLEKIRREREKVRNRLNKL